MKEKRNAKIIKTPDLLSYSARQQKKEKLPLLQQGYCFLALSTNRRIKKNISLCYHWNQTASAKFPYVGHLFLWNQTYLPSTSHFLFSYNTIMYNILSSVHPNAKINLGLFILDKRPDGYHNLETVFIPIPLRDNLDIHPLHSEDKPWQLELTGHPVTGTPETNLVIKVFSSLQQEFHLPPCSIRLDKKIPLGAGLGGGSSDAAFMMQLLNEKFNLGLSADECKQRLKSFGADCPFFIDNRPAFATGIGDILQPVSLSLKDKWLVLVKPPIPVSTRDAYAEVVCRKEAPVHLPSALQRPINEWRDTVINDFEKSVFKKHPDIQAIKETLYDMHALYASMSGSGSTVFGLFHQKPYADLNTIFPDCFVYTQQLLINS